MNNRFAVDPSTGSVKDEQAGKETRIEPRLMNLLCLLAANNGKLVARPHITKEIWDNYGNADEGLTQAVSYLRKVLADDTKSLIETVPKKGYILHGVVSESIHKTTAIATSPPTVRRKRIFIIGAIVLLLIAAWLVFKVVSPSNANNPDVIQQGQKATPGGSDKASGADVLPDSLKKNRAIPADKNKQPKPQ